MLGQFLFRLISFFFIYKLVRALIDYIARPLPQRNYTPKKKQQDTSGPVIEAEYRVISNKD